MFYSFADSLLPRPGLDDRKTEVLTVISRLYIRARRRRLHYAEHICLDRLTEGRQTAVP